jgi:phosphopantothenoylcysteine synthetase/decarboxylase
MVNDLHILLGVTGGIAAYKAVDLASKLTAAGARVRTVMTESACRLVTPKSFEAVTAAPVYTSLWSDPVGHSSSHISLADWAKIVVVAPATANILGKAANGICDDLLSTTLCVCWATPTVLAPTMNTRMWENPAVRRNVETLRSRGARIVGPASGRLACGTEGVGRMAEPQEILAAIEELAATNPRK